MPANAGQGFFSRREKKSFTALPVTSHATNDISRWETRNMTMNRPITSLLILSLLGGFVLCSGADGEPTKITSAVQLFIDDYVVDTTEGVRRNVHQWQKHAENPVLRPDKPWEYGGNYLNAYGSVIYDESERIFKAWYWTMKAEDSKVPTRNIKMMCYATSPDGIHWEKPNVGIYQFQDSTDNNNRLGHQI